MTRTDVRNVAVGDMLSTDDGGPFEVSGIITYDQGAHPCQIIFPKTSWGLHYYRLVGGTVLSLKFGCDSYRIIGDKGQRLECNGAMYFLEASGRAAYVSTGPTGLQPCGVVDYAIYATYAAGQDTRSYFILESYDQGPQRASLGHTLSPTLAVDRSRN